MESNLLNGYKHEAKTVLAGKLSKADADDLLEKKYDLETALVIENSVTDCVMQVSEMEQEMNQLKQIIEEMQEQNAQNSMR